MSEDWLALLRARVAEIGVSATARELGVSHGSVSTLIHEKYPGDTWRMADRVMKRYARSPYVQPGGLAPLAGVPEMYIQP